MKDQVIGIAPDATEFTPVATRALIASIVALLFGGAMNLGLLPLIMLPVSHELGWNRTQIGGMAGTFFIASAVGYPLWGYLADRFGARTVLLCATPLSGLAFFLMAALTPARAVSYATFAFAGLMATLTVAHVKGHSLRFDRRRGIVLALLGMTIGVSVGMTPFFGRFLLEAYGWRTLYIVFGFLPLLIAMPILFFWFAAQDSRAPRSGFAGRLSGTTFGAAVRTATFWMIVAMVVCSGFVFAGMQSHFIAFLEERGLSAEIAVGVLSAGVLAGLVCQIITGWLLDHWRSPRAALPFIAIAFSGMLLLQVAHTPLLTTVGAILLQGGVGGELSLIPYLVSRSFGTAHMARIYGTIAFTGQVLGGAAPVMMGRIHDQTHSYTNSLPIFAGVLAVAFLLAFLLGKSFRFERSDLVA